MNWLDAVIIVVALWFTIAAFQAGFIREIVTIVAAVIGVVLAGLFYEDLANDVLTFIDNRTVGHIVAFGAIFVALVLAGQLVALVLKPTVSLLQLGIFDQLAGAAFGFAKAVIFIEVFLLVFITYPEWGLGDAIDDSFFGSWTIDNVPFMERILPDEFGLAVDDFTGKI